MRGKIERLCSHLAGTIERKRPVAILDFATGLTIEIISSYAYGGDGYPCLDSDLPPEEKEPWRLSSEAQNLLHAGSETSSKVIVHAPALSN